MYTVSNSDDNMITDEQLQNMFEVIDENLDEYRVDNTIPNYVIDEDGPDNILKTEINVCEKCMHPNIIGAEPFNRREKNLYHIKLDSVVQSSLWYFAKINRLEINAALGLLLRIVNTPEVSKMVMGTFSNIPKRKGKRVRSRLSISS